MKYFLDGILTLCLMTIAVISLLFHSNELGIFIFFSLFLISMSSEKYIFSFYDNL